MGQQRGAHLNRMGASPQSMSRIYTRCGLARVCVPIHVRANAVIARLCLLCLLCVCVSVGVQTMQRKLSEAARASEGKTRDEAKEIVEKREVELVAARELESQLVEAAEAAAVEAEATVTQYEAANAAAEEKGAVSEQAAGKDREADAKEQLADQACAELEDRALVLAQVHALR